MRVLYYSLQRSLTIHSFVPKRNTRQRLPDDVHATTGANKRLHSPKLNWRFPQSGCGECLPQRMNC